MIKASIDIFADRRSGDGPHVISPETFLVGRVVAGKRYWSTPKIVKGVQRRPLPKKRGGAGLRGIVAPPVLDQPGAGIRLGCQENGCLGNLFHRIAALLAVSGEAEFRGRLG